MLVLVTPSRSCPLRKSVAISNRAVHFTTSSIGLTPVSQNTFLSTAYSSEPEELDLSSVFYMLLNLSMN